MNLRKHAGFTLVEVLIVVVIVTLLVSVMMYNISEARAKARDTKRVSDIGTIVIGLKQYRADNGHYPCSMIGGSYGTDFIKPLEDGGYISSVPRDPINDDTYYHYQYGSFRESPADTTCGDYATLHLNFESPGTECPYGGQMVEEDHCHVILPRPVPCSDPWLVADDMPDDCDAIHDIP